MIILFFVYWILYLWQTERWIREKEQDLKINFAMILRDMQAFHLIYSSLSKMKINEIKLGILGWNDKFF
jgi:hypothetical protein